MNNLYKIMTEKEFSSQKLSDATGIPKRTIDNYRSGRREPLLRNGVLMADALGVHPRRLINDKPKENHSKEEKEK